MAVSKTDKSKVFELQSPSKEAEIQLGASRRQAASGAGASAPPLDSNAIARIQRSPHSALRSDILALQRSVGNRAVAALVRGDSKEVAIQAKLEVGPVNDSYEQEADRVARLVTSGITQRKPAGNVKSKDEESEEGAPLPGVATTIKRMMQRKSANSVANSVAQPAARARADGSFAADSTIQRRIRRMEQGGRPLTDSVRRQMEPGFGANLSRVRIHTGGDAVQLSRDIGARAFTHGSHIAFANGQYNPASRDGRHLLAHELTHTIQQTGAQPLPAVQRSPKGARGRGPRSVIQRASTWERVKSFFSSSTPQDSMIIEDVPGKLTKEIQAAAKQKVMAARDRAKSLIPAARDKAVAAQTSHADTDSELGKLGTDTGKDKGNVYARARKAAVRSQRGDVAHKNFLTKFQKGLDETMEKLEGNVLKVEAVDPDISSIIEEPKSGWNYSRGIRRKALRSHAYAKESSQMVKALESQIAGMSENAQVEEGMARGGLKAKTGFYEAKSLGAAEKVASDSVMTLAGMKSKVEGYLAYVKADLTVLQGYMATKGAALNSQHGGLLGARVMGFGMARGQSGEQSGILSEQESFDLGGGSGGTNQSKDLQNESQDDLVKAQFEAGKLAGKNYSNKPTNQPKPPKKDLKKNEKAFAKQVKEMEVTSRLYAGSLKRLPLMEGYVVKVTDLHERANVIYQEIDRKRGIKKPTQKMINDGIIDAGKAKVMMAEGGRFTQLGYILKKQIYDESQNESNKAAVGERAMSSGKRMGKKFAGLLLNAGMRTISGGLKGYSAEDEAGGYRVGIKSQTILDDIAKKKIEIDQIVHGLDKNPVRGLGGRSGARAYAAFKWIAFGLQIVRNLAAGIALWVTLVTAGVGAPIGAVFASISLFALIAKAAFDLLLLVWSGVGLGKTNDPRSRAILRGENTRQGLAFGEGVFGVTPLAAMMGTTNNMGLMNGTKQTQFFEGHGLGGQIGNQGVNVGSKLVGNLGQNVGVNNLSNYAVESGYETRKLNDSLHHVRKGKTAMRVLSHPLRSAFSSLGDFVNKKKRLREKKFAALIPELAKSIGDLNEHVQSIPTDNGSTTSNGDNQRSPLPPPSPPPSVVSHGVSNELPEAPETIPSGPPAPPSPLLQSSNEDIDLDSEG